MIGRMLGPYRVTERVGAGGMGEVYRARDTKLDRDVALKVLPESFATDPDRLMRFEREAKTLASINHPNIAAIYGIEGPALVMELVDGEDLAERLARGPIPIDDALPIARQIADALEAAHEQGIIHRDLKPANVKVRADGTVKVLDFGLAKAIEQGPGIRDQGPGKALANSPTITSPAMTHAGMILGTAAYMSPEQAKGKAVDKRSDIWAFGAVLYEMLTGQRAFQGEDVSDLLVAVLTRNADLGALPPGTPRSIVRLIQSCLERDPKNRLRDIGDARIAVTETLSGGAEAVSDHSAAGATQPRHWKRLAGGLAIVSLALASALVWFVTRPMDREVSDAGILRFTLVDDPNMELHLTSQPFAVSPDGKTVVFNASASSSGLWVRSLDQPTARFIAGTEGGLQPAIAPDAQWVAFVVANHIIRKVRLSGGTPTTIAAIDDVTASLSWESNDALLFEKIGSSSGIHRVSANGGTPQVLIPLGPDEQSHRIPVVLREVKLVMHAVLTADGRETLSAFSLDDGRRSRLDLDGFRALGLVDGHLVYARSDGVVMAAPFDARGMRVTGEPRQLEPKVWGGQFGPSVTLSESGTLVSLPAVSSMARLLLVDQSRAVPVGEPRAYEAPRFSPDGHRIAVGIADGDGLDLWTMDRATGAATRVTRHAGRRSRLESWTPDSRSLIHRRDNAMWIVPVDGSEDPRKLVDVDGRVLGASLLPDGQSIVVLRRVRVGQGNLDREELVRVPLTGDRTVAPIFASRSSGSVLRGTDPRTSPDGRWVAIHDRNDNQVHVRAIDGGAGVQVSDMGGSVPVWGHDSRTLYYRTAAGTMKADLLTDAAIVVLRRHLVPGLPTGGTVHDVSNDGTTFLILAPVDPAPKVVVTMNWAADVRRQLRGAP